MERATDQDKELWQRSLGAGRVMRENLFVEADYASYVWKGKYAKFMNMDTDRETPKGGEITAPMLKF